MFRRILPLAMLVMIAILAVVFFTGREGQFAAAASRLPDQVLHRAQTLRSDVQGKVVILQDIVADETEQDPEEPVLLESGVPAGGEDAATGQAAGQANGQATDEPAGAAVYETAGKPGRSGAAGASGAGDAAASGDASGEEGGGH
jgi:hypothetical protein